MVRLVQGSEEERKAQMSELTVMDLKKERSDYNEYVHDSTMTMKVGQGHTKINQSREKVGSQRSIVDTEVNYAENSRIKLEREGR